MLVFPGNRAMVYLQKLINEKCLPSHLLVINNGHATFAQTIKLCNDQSLTYDIVDAQTVNDDAIKQALKSLPEEYFIFTGGGILDKEMVGIKKFVHSHPGLLPDYKGSTTIYYSLLNENKCGVTAFIMDPKIDGGEIIFQREYETPKSSDIDYTYDPTIRAHMVADVFKNKKFLQTYAQTREGKDYYVVHPVLKHIVLLSIGNGA
jgi:methionyl-tRNA formyltransferase